MSAQAKTPWGRASRLTVLMLGVAAVGFALVALEIAWYAKARDDQPADVAIVLGAAAWHHRPSPVLKERLREAVELYKRGDVQAIILTGGYGPGAPLAESEVGRRYVIEQGVLPNDVYVETQSRITLDNLREASSIAERLGFRRVLVVSDPLHMRRAVSMARALGLDAHPCPTRTTRFRSLRARAGMLLRETTRLIAYRASHV